MGDRRSVRRWGAAVATAAAFGIGSFAGAVALSGPAWAAEGVKVALKPAQLTGKVGDKVDLEITVLNVSDKAEAKNVVVAVQAPGNAVIDGGDCEPRNGGRSALCNEGSIAARKTVTLGVSFTIKAGGNAAGRVTAAEGIRQDSAGFSIRATGATPSATPTKKPSKDPSGAASNEPSLPDESMAPPVGGGVFLQTSEAAPSRAADSGGLSFGFWVGIVAIVAALGLVGSLFYFRRKDKNEPDTGMHPVVPPPDGFPPSGGYGTPTTYGAPAAPTTYGTPSAPPPYGGATQIIPPADPPQPPPANDQTVMFRRPEEF